MNGNRVLARNKDGSLKLAVESVEVQCLAYIVENGTEKRCTGTFWIPVGKRCNRKYCDQCMIALVGDGGARGGARSKG